MKAEKLLWNDPDFVEAIRLINKFFPESVGYVNASAGISIYKMVESMEIADLNPASPFAPFVIPPGAESGEIPGFEGGNEEIYLRLIEHAGFFPSGRAVVVPDALGKGWSLENLRPFVCKVETLPLRLHELADFFDGMHDSILVFESGEAICVDHDLRVFCAQSRIRKLKEK